MFFKVLLLCSLCLYEATGQQMICQPLDSPAIQVDYDRINAAIDEKLQPVITDYNNLKETCEARIEVLEKKVASLLPDEDRCDVEYNGKCFWAVVHDVQDVNFTNAANLCKESGGHGAEIYNKEHYDKIIEYLRTKIPSTHPTVMEVWTGVKFNQNTGVAYDLDGNTAFAHWYPGHPYTGSHYYSDWTGVRFRTESVASSSTQGMMTGKQIWEIFGALCEK